jgi:inosine-uridine nucleoside N-ribohydrolase
VLGIISAHAPSLPDPSAHATYLVLRDEVEHRMGLTTHPPLLEGSSLPLADVRTPRPNAGSRFLIEQSRRFDREHRLVVLTIGAATDVASAILEDPSIVDRIEVVAMAFTNLSPGGAKEFNVENDVKAWQVLLDSSVPLTIGSGDVCRQYLALDFQQARQLTLGHGPVAEWLWEEFEAWYFRQVMPVRSHDFSRSWFIWDIITLAYERGLATAKTIPRPRLTDDVTFDQGAPGRTIQWITTVDSARLWKDVFDRLDEFESRHAVGVRGGSPLIGELCSR